MDHFHIDIAPQLDPGAVEPLSRLALQGGQENTGDK